MDVFNLFAKIGLDSRDFEHDMDETEKKTNIFSDVLKANLITNGINVVANGLVALGKQMAGFMQSSIDAYADFEQLVGGVETLFKDGADIVKGYAENAYKTAGLSANEYMETVTAFSASLVSSLGGNTKQAAEVADMAITDMADNANKMGTDMASIQNAYQGFAKQNYTMLDNLKLGKTRHCRVA